MKKNEFLEELRRRLNGLPKDDLNNRINFYEESINDRIDEGKSEDEAVAEIGSVDEVVKEIASDTSLVKLVKEKVKPKEVLEAWKIVLICLGFPVWIPILVAVSVLLIIAYILVWVLVIVSYSIELALIGTSIFGLIGFIMYLVNGDLKLAPLGLFIGCVGGFILFFYVCKYSTKITISLSKAIILKIKTNIINRGSK